MFYVLNASYYLLVQLLKPPLKKRMEWIEEELIVSAPVEVGDHDHDEEDVEDVREGPIFDISSKSPIVAVVAAEASYVM